MERIRLKELNENFSAYDGKTVTVAGWARTIRDSKAFGFIELNDGSCFKNTQIVFERANLGNYDEIAKQNVGCALIVTGVVVVTPENKQPYEIKATEIAVEGECRKERFLLVADFEDRGVFKAELNRVLIVAARAQVDLAEDG